MAARVEDFPEPVTPVTSTRPRSSSEIVFLDLQRQLLSALATEPRTCLEIAEQAGGDAGDAWPVLRHLASNRDEVRLLGAPDPATARFALVGE